MSVQASKINQEACAWIAKLHGAEPTTQELEELREWMQQSAEHKAELRRLAEMWDELNILTELAVPLDRPEPEVVSHGWLTSLFNRHALVGALTTAVLLVAVLFVWQPLDTAPSLSYSTAIGEQKTVTLSDNSTILLNTNSHVRVDYTRQSRNIYLIQGEAHFDVFSNQDKPFRVYAGKGLVRAVGTAFSVYLKNRVVEVTVTEGRVEIDAVKNSDDQKQGLLAVDINLGSAIVDAGQRATFDQDEKSVESIEEISPPEISQKLSWHDGLVRFSGDPLEEVVEEISRYTSTSIVILDPELRDLRIGGFFKVGETGKMFEALESGFGVRVERVGESLIHLSAANSATGNP